MATATKHYRATSNHRGDAIDARRIIDLIETVNACDSPLKVDEEQGIIYGVKVLGRYSPNNYGLREAVNGTEYPPDTMRAALPLYEGMKVRVNHLPLADRRTPDKERGVEDTFGILRNVRVEGESIRADLHYVRSHDMAAKVVEDVKRGLGLYGLSHNAGQAREHFDQASKRLIIESIGVVRSVDLVDKPATNRNLWESQEPTVSKMKKYTMRSLLESQRTRFSKARLGYLDRLLEEGDMAAPLDAPAEMPEESASDPNEAMRSAFEASITAIIQSALSGDTDPKEALKKIGEMLKTHEKLTAKDEPEPVKVESEEEDDKPAPKDDKTESVQQKLERMERKDACRDLCESLGFTPKPDQLSALMEISTPTARKVTAEAFKVSAAGAQTPAGKKPRSTGPGINLRESKSGKIDGSIAGDMVILRRG